MKKVLISLLIAASTITFAQESFTTEPSELIEASYKKAKSYEAQNNILEAAKAYAKVSELENQPVYWAKNKDTKEKIYFTDKTLADKTTSEGNYSSVKQLLVEKKYSNEIIIKLQTQYQAAYKIAQTAFETKDYNTSSKKFEECYYLNNALGNEEKLLLYYAAISYQQANKNPEAIKIYKKLIKEEYNGKEGNQGLLEDMYQNTSYLYMSAKDYNNALIISKEGAQKFPANKGIAENLALAYYKSGNEDEFLDQLEKNIAQDPTNAENFYNAALMYAKKEGEITKALDYLSKSLNIEPNNLKAYQNYVHLINKEDELTTKIISKLGTSKADIKKEDEVLGNLKTLYKTNIFMYEKAIENFPKERVFYQAIQRAFYILGDDAGYDKYKALENAM